MSVRKMCARIGVLTLILLLAVAASASAAVRCVGSSGGDCTSSHATINAAVGAATDGADTIRIAAGTYDEAIDTPKVLTFEGAGSGTLTNTTGATVIKPSPPPNSAVAAFTLPNGGTLRALRAEGSNPGDCSPCDGGHALNFAPQVAGSREIEVSEAVFRGVSGGRAIHATTSGQADREMNLTIDRSALQGGGGFDWEDAVLISGQGQTNVTRSRFAPSGATTALTTNGQKVTLEDSTIDASTYSASISNGGLTATRSRLTSLRGLSVSGPGPSVLRDSLVTARSLTQSGRTASLAALGVGNTGNTGLLVEGSTIVGARGDTASQSPLAAILTFPSSGQTSRVTLRNSIVRFLDPAAPDRDLFAGGGTIDADYTLFNSRAASDGGSASAPGSAHNVTGNPLFTDPAGGDFTVKRCSPVIDRGNPSLFAPGQLDLSGNARSLDGDGDGTAAPDLGAFERTDVSSGCPPPPAPPASEPTGSGAVAGVSFDQVAPTLSRISLSRSRFAPFPRRGRAPRRGTRFRFHLSERATVKITFHRILGGRRAKIAGRRRCVEPRRSRRGRRCERTLRFGWLKSTEDAGNQSIVFKGRLKGRALKPGRWQATLEAFDGDGAHRKAKRVRFRVVKP